VKRLYKVEITPYRSGEFGLLAAKKRLTRVRFSDNKPSNSPDHTYRALLPKVYEKMAVSPLVPIILPERIKAEWSEDERAFILHGAGLRGFGVKAIVQNVREDEPQNASEDDVVAVHGSPLPRLG
jgi:hypothetical protein